MNSRFNFSPSRAIAALAISAAFAGPIAATELVVPSAAFACNGKTGKIDGVSKCLHAGEFCKKASASQYKKYGFACTKQDANGRWHLVAN